MTIAVGVSKRSCRIAAVAYLLSVVSGVAVLLAERDEAFIRFHAWQSILMGVTTAVAWLMLKTVPIVGTALAVGFVTLWVVATLYIAARALAGHRSALPLIGDIAIERMDGAGN